MALLALIVALMLSPPRLSAWAWYQSPVSPVSPVLTQPAQAPTSSPAVPAITPTPVTETLIPSDTQLPETRGRGTATVVAGGIVLIGLVVGAVVLLVRGQAPEELES